MRENSKITPAHLCLTACIYIRQSTQHQVQNNIESQERQYELAQRAEEFGWRSELIEIIDEDLARSARSVEGRTGFSSLVADVALKKVGIIFGIEVSRLARNNRDWYQLLDLCSATNTLIADADGVYDPSLFNDRLLLGLKGTMSEAEIHTLKSRMLEGMRHKAQKGELKFILPVGYEFDDEDQIIKTKNEEVAHFIDLIFEKFFKFNSVSGVLRYLLEDNLLFPRKAAFDKKVRWVKPYYKAVYDSLTNPLYTGTYVFGRSKVEKVIDEDGNQKSQQKKQPMEKWDVVIHDNHPKYISWEDYLKLLKQIEQNRAPLRGESSKVAREGSALLQGITRCGVCGRSMTVRYHGQQSSVYPFYVCGNAARNNGKLCQSIGGRRIDHTVGDMFLEVVSPASINIELQALEQLEQEKDATLQQLELQLERAKYEAERMYRQYDSVEPENRLVVRTLEKQWNDALVVVQGVEKRIKERQRQTTEGLSVIEKDQIVALAKNIPAIWNATSTTDKDRKRLIRVALEEVQLLKEDRKVSLKLVWKGGAVSDREIYLPKVRSSRATSLDVVELVRQLATKYSDTQIARILIRKGLKTPTGLSYNAHKVGNLRGQYKIPCYDKSSSTNEESYTAEQAARLFEVSVPTIHRWVSLGMLKGNQMTEGAPWEIVVTDEDKKKLKADEVPSGWLSIQPAAAQLGVSKQTVLNWVKEGKLEYCYVTKGQRRGLRINVNSATCGAQTRLFV